MFVEELNLNLVSHRPRWCLNHRFNLTGRQPGVGIGWFLLKQFTAGRVVYQDPTALTRL